MLFLNAFPGCAGLTNKLTEFQILFINECTVWLKNPVLFCTTLANTLYTDYLDWNILSIFVQRTALSVDIRPSKISIFAPIASVQKLCGYFYPRMT